MSDMVQFSDAAASRVAQLVDRQGNPALKLRLSVNGGGCSGFQYKFDFDTVAQDDDVVVTNGPATLLVDSISLPFLAGSIVDYVESLGGSSFQVRNPNAQSSCGCGTSFSV
jgi:iron-sulfur cluster insertion protein